MTGEGMRRLAALAAVLAAAALTACGDSGDDGGSPATEAGSRPSAKSEPDSPQKQGGESRPKQDDGAEKPSPVDPAPLEISGGGSDQYRVEGGDNSIQEFGEESDESELEEAAGALHGYLVARAEENWPDACSGLAKAIKEQLALLASRSDRLKDKDCPAVLEALTPSLPPAVRRQSTVLDAASLRTEGERAFLIYRGREAIVFAQPMTMEDGSWKVGSLGASPIS